MPIKKKPPSPPLDKDKTASWDAFEVDTTQHKVADGRERSKSKPSSIDSQLTRTAPNHPAMTTAPEVSRGAWRERVFNPRVVLNRDQLKSELARALTNARAMRAGLETVRSSLKTDLLPLLRQAVEQAGGDGMDCYLCAALGGEVTQARDPLLRGLVSQMQRINGAVSPQALFEEAQRLADLVQNTLNASTTRPLSLTWLEKELDGRLDVDVVLTVAFASDKELAKRNGQVEKAVDLVRQQMKSMPGTQPDGMYQNFARLKVEWRLLEGELRRRTK